MAKRGRKAQDEQKVPYNALIPEGLAAKIDLLLLNPMTGKIKYGARSQLIEKILRRWLEEQISAGSEAEPFTPDLGRYAGNRSSETQEE